VTSIDSYVFSTSGIKSITIPESVTKISCYAFESCNLTSIVIPENVKEIEWNAFDGCTNLITVVIPKSVTKIGNKVFQNCKSLRSVLYKGIDDPCGSSTNVFLNCSKLEHICITDIYNSTMFCNLSNNKPSQCYEVISSGIMEEIWYMKNGTILIEGARELAPYFEDEKHYVVGDQETNEAVSTDMIVDRDVKLTVMKRNVLEIIFDAEVKEVNTTELVEMIINLVPNGTAKAENVIVEVIYEYDHIRVSISVGDVNIAEDIVDAVNHLDKSSGCELGVLCRSKDAYVVYDVDWISLSCSEMKVVNKQMIIMLILLSILMIMKF